MTVMTETRTFADDALVVKGERGGSVRPSLEPAPVEQRKKDADRHRVEEDVAQLRRRIFDLD